MSPKKGAGKKSSEKEYSVEKVVNKRAGKRGVEYLVKWTGYPSGANTWEPASHLNCKDLVEEYEKEHAPKSPTPKRARLAAPQPSTSAASAASAPSPRGDKNALKKMKSVQRRYGDLSFMCEMGDGSEKRFSRAEAHARWPSQVLELYGGIVSRMLKDGDSISV